MAEQIGRKGSVTQNAGNLSGPDLSAASFSRAGVVDQSGLFRGEAKAAGISGIANAIADAGQFALDVDEGIAKANLERDLLDEVRQAEESRDPDFAAQQAARQTDASVDFVAQQEAANLQREQFGEGAAIAATDPEFADITRRLKNAQRTGVISLDEFELRTTEALRRAIAKRPGLASELSAHASLTLGLNGARERLALQDKLLAEEGQQDAARRDRAIKQLDRANVAFDFNAPTKQLEDMLNTKRKQDEAYEQGKRIREIKEVVNQEEGLAVLRQNGSTFGAGAYNNAAQTMMSLFTPDMSSSELSRAKVQALNVVTQFTDEFDALGRNLSLTNSSEFKDLKANWTGAMENLAKSLEDASSGSDAANIARNFGAVIQNQWQRQVFDSGVNPELARVANHMAPFIEATGLIKRQPHLQAPMAQIYESLLLQMTNAPGLDRALDSRVDGKTSDLALVLGNAARTSLPADANKPGSKVPTDFENMVNTSLEVIDRNIGRNQSVAFKAMTDTIRTLANPELRNSLLNATPDTKVNLVELGIKQASALEPDRNRFMIAASEQGVNIQSRILPDGSLQFFTQGNTDKDRSLLRQFNNKFAKKYNDLIRYNSVMFGMSVPESAELMGEIYGGGTTDDIRKAIDSRRAGLQEDSTEKTIKDNIKKEEGFRQRAYLDQAGVPTIGYGFTEIGGRPVKIGDTITREQAERELARQVDKHSNFKDRVSVPLSPSQEEALASFEYNLGPNIWGGSGAKIIQAVNDGDLERAAELMQTYNKVRNPKTGKLEENKGLVNRRAREAGLLLGEG